VRIAEHDRRPEAAAAQRAALAEIRTAELGARPRAVLDDLLA
jgi:hypothetical protein